MSDVEVVRNREIDLDRVVWREWWFILGDSRGEIKVVKVLFIFWRCIGEEGEIRSGLLEWFRY